MLKTISILFGVLLLASCNPLNNRHDTLAVQCDLNSRTQDKVLIKFTNPGGVELTPEQVAQLQVQYEGISQPQKLSLSSRACVALPMGSARIKARISGDMPLTVEIKLDELAATDTIHTVALEAPGVLELALKCPKNGWLAAGSLENIVDVKRSLGKLNGYSVDLSVYNSAGELVQNLFTKDLQSPEFSLPEVFDLKNIGEGNYNVNLTVVDSYHEKSGNAAKSQCGLTIRRSCAKDETFDAATVSCIPKLCDNAYRVGARWTEGLALQRGEGRYECRLEDGKAKKTLLSHSCQAGFFKSSDSCLAAKEIAGNCALLESDEVVCWGTLLGKDNYPTRKDVNYQTTLKFPERVRNFGHQCAEMQTGKMYCWSITLGSDSSYQFMQKSETPKNWNEAISRGLVDPGERCSEPEAVGQGCNFHLGQLNGVNAILPTPIPSLNGNCIVDSDGRVWCNQHGVPRVQSLASSVKAGPYYRVEVLRVPARQVRSDGSTFCALQIDGFVLCWGDNTVGSAGLNLSETFVNKPGYVIQSNGQKLEDIRQISSSQDYNSWRTTYALTNSGRVFAWGTNLDGTLANGTPGEDDEGNPLFSRFAVPIDVDVMRPIIPPSDDQ